MEETVFMTFQNTLMSLEILYAKTSHEITYAKKFVLHLFLQNVHDLSIFFFTTYAWSFKLVFSNVIIFSYIIMFFLLSM